MIKIREMGFEGLTLENGASIYETVGSQSGADGRFKYRVTTRFISDKRFENFETAWAYAQKAPFQNREEAVQACKEARENGVASGEGVLIAGIVNHRLALKNGATVYRVDGGYARGTFRFIVRSSDKDYERPLRFLDWKSAWAYAQRAPFSNRQEALEVCREVSLPSIADFVARHNQYIIDREHITQEMVENAYDYSVQSGEMVFFNNRNDLIDFCPENRKYSKYSCYWRG